MRHVTSAKLLFSICSLFLIWSTTGHCQKAAAWPGPVDVQSAEAHRQGEHPVTEIERDASTVLRMPGDGSEPIIQRPDEQVDVIRIAPPPIQPVPAGDGRRMLEAGWDAFGLRSHAQALDFFEQARAALPPGAGQNEATLGMAYSLGALERHDEAVSLLEMLMDAGYRREEVQAALFRTLILLERLDQAEALLAGLSEVQQQDLRLREIQLLRFEQDLTTVLQSRKVIDFKHFLGKYHPWLEQCRQPYAFYQVSRGLQEQGERRLARDIARQLLTCPLQGREQGLYVPLLQTVIRGLPYDQAQSEISRQRSALQGRTAALSELDRLELELLRDRFTAISPEEPEHAQLARQILRLAPEDDGLRMVLAWNCYESGDDACAEGIFRDLLQRLPGNVSALEGLAATLERQGRIEEAIDLLEQAEVPALFEPVMVRLYRGQAVRSFAEKDYAQTLLWLDKHDALTRDDPEILAMRSWALFHLAHYEPALDVFAKRLELAPDAEDALMGMGLSLQALDRPQEAVVLLQTHWDADRSEEYLALLGSLFCTLGGQQYAAGNLDQAVVYLQHCVELDPDAGSLQLLGWSLFELGNPQAAFGHFQEAFDREQSHETAEALLVSARELDQRTVFWPLLQDLASHANPMVRTATADAYFRENLPVLAAQVHPESGLGTCYHHCDASLLEGSVRFRSVTGDPGLSRLDDLSFPLQYSKPSVDGRVWSLRVTPRLLDANKAPTDAYMGSFYRFLDEGQTVQSPLDRIWVLTPEAEYEREGQYSFQAMLGTTPIGGPIHAMPTFRLGLGRQNDWGLELGQVAVQDSLLSFIGQRDPYSEQSWGRVLRTGLTARKAFDLSGPYWLSMEAGYAYYWGENTSENHSLSGNLSLGRTDDIQGLELTGGLFLTAFGYENNQNFFTLGHGGYFSPERFIITGPFVRLRSPQCKNYLFDLQASLGWMDYTESSAPHYRKLSGEPPLGRSEAARNDIQGRYPRQSKSALAAMVDLQAMKLITDNVALGAMAGVNNASDHTQWQAGLMLQYFFKPKSIFCDRSGF